MISSPPRRRSTPAPGPRNPLAAVLLAALTLGALASFSATPAAGQTPNLVAEHNRRARDLIERGLIEEAADEWREALKIAPKNVVIRRNLGVALLKLGLVEEAEEVVLGAVSLEPNHAVNHLILGRIYLRQGKTGMAEAELRTAQRLDPVNPEIDINLAVLAMRKGAYLEAESHLERALTFNYNDPDVHAALGDVYRATGEWDRAEASYRSALELDAFHLGAKRGLQELEADKTRAAASPEERQLMGLLRVENPTTRIEGGLFVVEGQVVNHSQRATAKYVTVTCQFYDDQQRIIAEKDTHPEPDILGPGQRGHWKLSVPHDENFSGQMEIGVKAVVEDPEAESAQAGGTPAKGPVEEQATFFGGDKVSREDVLKVSIPKLATQGGKAVLRGYVLNVGTHPVASIDLNFRVVERQGGRLYTQRFAHIDREILEPGQRADYTLDWKEGLDPARFRLQMKIGWAELPSSPPGPQGEASPPEEPSPKGPPPSRLPTPMPEPPPRPPRN